MMMLRWTKKSGVARKLSACAPAAFASLIAGAISSGLVTEKTNSSILRWRAALRSSSKCRGTDCDIVPSANAAIRRAPGTASIKRSCRLPSSSGANMLTPVVLPFGRASDPTKPAATKLPEIATIGTVLVAFWMALV